MKNWGPMLYEHHAPFCLENKLDVSYTITWLLSNPPIDSMDEIIIEKK